MSTAGTDLEALLEPLGGDLNVGVIVTSLDGIAAIGGRVGQLTGTADQRLLLGVRERSLAVVVGAATVRAEGYGALLPAAAQQKRAAAGMNPQPELVVLSRTTDGIAGTEAARNAADLRTTVETPPATVAGEPDLRALSAGIRERHGPGLAAWEGGPRIMHFAIGQGVLDELLLAVSPLIAGHGLPLAGAIAGGPHRLKLLGSAASEDFVFLRYGFRDGA